MLAAAVCKLEGFTYAPSSSHYWRHGHSTERDFIYVTTQTLARDQLQHLSDQVGAERSLLVCCGAFRVQRVEDFPNLTIKKIPTAVLARCEWGRDDYSLQVANLPLAPEGPLVAPQVVAEAEDGVTVQGFADLRLKSPCGRLVLVSTCVDKTPAFPLSTQVDTQPQAPK
ncbi:MAG: hypothetical protein R2867_07710 [Caldilineaceae bacterium]